MGEGPDRQLTWSCLGVASTLSCRPSRNAGNEEAEGVLVRTARGSNKSSHITMLSPLSAVLPPMLTLLSAALPLPFPTAFEVVGCGVVAVNVVPALAESRAPSTTFRSAPGLVVTLLPIQPLSIADSAAAAAERSIPAVVIAAASAAWSVVIVSPYPP